MKHSILFIRNTDEQMTGGDCCGRVMRGGSIRGFEGEAPEIREKMEAIGDLYCKAKDIVGENASLVQVDPRNLGYLIPRLWGDVWRFRPPLKEALRTLFLTFSPPAVVIDGRIAFNRQVPSVEELEAAIS